MTRVPENYAVAVVAETPNGIPLVLDPRKPSPHFWKFPGGRNQPGETPAETAARELKEETAIDLPPDRLTLVHEESRAGAQGDHSFFLFHSDVKEPVAISERGAGGELVRFFTRQEIKNLPDFFPNHRALTEKILFRGERSATG